MEGTRPNAYEYGGHPAPSGRALPNLKPYRIGGHPAPAGPALPNLINAVKMLKSKSTPTQFLMRAFSGGRGRFWLRRDRHVDFDFDFKILTAFIRLGRARPEGAGCPPYL